jgi:hypothetical protein
MSSKFVWEEGDVEILDAPIVVTKGGAGSGHYGHSGRPGEHGGSLPGKGSGLVVSDTFTGMRCTRAVIMNGKVYEGDENKGAYHTPTMARMVVAGHIPNSLHMKRAALEIIYDKIPEDSVFESKIMRMTDAYDVQLDNKLLIVDQEKIPRYGENVGVSEGINSLLRRVQRDVKRGIIDPIGCNEIFLSYSTASVRIPFFELDDIAQIIWNDQYETVLQYKHVVVVKGGAGSGDFGHSGRPGEVGGSSGGHAGVGTSKIPIDMQNAYRSKAKEMGYEGNMRFEESYEGDVEVYGYYDNATDTIVICDRSWKDKKGKQVLAHEISHAKWREVTDASANEDKRTQDFDNYVNRHEVVLYEAGMKIQLPYAKKFWEEYGAYGEYDTPMNETFAEFSRKIMQYGGDASQVKSLIGADNPLWLAYEKFEEAYASLHE